jgi:glucose-6-phosphate isomerase
LATKAEAVEQIEAIYKIVRHLYANDRGIVLEGNLGQPSSVKVSLQS